MTEHQTRERTSNRAPDASDVVDGPVGSAWLKDPATSGPMGADLDALPSIDIKPSDPRDEGRSIDGHAEPHERHDRDHVGVNLDLTRPSPGEGHG